MGLTEKWLWQRSCLLGVYNLGIYRNCGRNDKRVGSKEFQEIRVEDI